MISIKQICYRTSINVKHCFQDESGRFMLPYDSELECKLNIVVYDSNTRNLKEESMKI